jgi:hypothetical protein
MSKPILISIDRLEKIIYQIRGEKVMLDRDLAQLYGVETKVLKQTVKRNLRRFPDEFMFVLTAEELKDWRSQFVTSKGDRKGLRHAPMAFTEYGVLMLSSVLRSERSIQVNIEIMRAYLRLRRMAVASDELARNINALERRYDRQFKIVFDAIRELIGPKARPRRQIGFRPRR